MIGDWGQGFDRIRQSFVVICQAWAAFHYFSTKGKGTDKGTGLGLAITHSIVTQHGGDIHVESRNSAGGATFTIYLPVCQESL
ncbi:MAG: hypothetical protein KQI78_17335 [Deltaproteobacteria bacterium]|nr:hypothetical protein [Deltaproteobacteria bacterium]